MKLTLPHYGLHELASGVRFLVQAGGVTSTPGLDLSKRIEVNIADRWTTCPHDIDLTETADPDLLPDHPLVTAFLPLPTENKEPIYIDDANVTQEVVQELRRLGSPSAFDNLHMFFNREKPRMFRNTNIMPMVWMGFNWRHPQQSKRVLQLSSTGDRRPIMMLPNALASKNLGYVETWDLDPEGLKSLPLEKIGASVVLKYLKHQAL